VNCRICVFVLLTATASFIVTPSVRAQTTPPVTTTQSSTLDDTMTASEADAPSERKIIKWNEFEGKYATIRFGGGLLFEFNAYAQNDESKSQFEMHPQEKLRDHRVLLNGKFKFFKRPVTYQFGEFANPDSWWTYRKYGGAFLSDGPRKASHSTKSWLVIPAGPWNE
jgi:hypothetical protein